MLVQLAESNCQQGVSHGVGLLLNQHNVGSKREKWLETKAESGETPASGHRGEQEAPTQAEPTDRDEWTLMEANVA